MSNINTFAANRGRLFAGLNRRGVYMFDERFKTWIPAGLDGLTVSSLKSHQSDLYAATNEGIYRATISVVQPHGKSATTWAPSNDNEILNPHRHANSPALH